MKVLLVGEFSNVHNTLQQGLRELGVTADTLNSGDGYRKFHSDIHPIKIENRFVRKCYNDIFVNYLSHKYDVIQFMAELEYGRIAGLDAKMAVPLAKNARLSVLLLAGCNWEYKRFGKEKVGISPCEECLKYDLKKKYACSHFYNKGNRKIAYAMQKGVDIMVPMSYEYDICNKYGPFANKVADPICMPMKVQDNPVTTSKEQRRLLVYHPLNREGFKGTTMIREAFGILQEQYKDVAEFIIDGKMPFEEYSKLIERVDIVVDQKNAVAFGMGSLQAMAKGKILITGNYRKNISDPKFEYVKNAPAFELGTTVEEIVNNISSVIEKRAEYEDLREKGITYVKTRHDYKKVAQEFVNLYERHLG